jgi:sulfur-oxidizing protein SoxA
MRKHVTIGAAALALSLGVATGANSQEIRSGYYWATVETRAMQDDEFQNPGMIWVEQGSEIWNTVEGEAGKSCASCHGDAEDSMKGVGASYPKYRDELGKLQSLEQRINECRVKNMKAKEWKWESGPLLSMTSFVRHQSRGVPVAVAIDGPAAPFFEKGKELYNTRMGQLDMACKHCHEDNPGGILRANTLTQGQSNGFPTYRLKWQKVGSIHRRFRGCNKNIRAKPFGYGSDEYVNLELYVAWRGRGLPIETPAVRN